MKTFLAWMSGKTKWQDILVSDMPLGRFPSRWRFSTLGPVTMGQMDETDDATLLSKPAIGAGTVKTLRAALVWLKRKDREKQRLAMSAALAAMPDDQFLLMTKTKGRQSLH